MTTVPDNEVSHASSGDEHPTPQVHNFSPTPVGSEPEYDCLSTAPENGSSRTGSTFEHPADGVVLLSPTPPGYAPEYDYLATLKAVSQENGLVEPTELLTAWSGALHVVWDHMRRRDLTCRACIIDSSGSQDLFAAWNDSNFGDNDMVKWIYHEIKDMRRKMSNDFQESPFVLVLEHTNPLVLQVLGATLDLDPEPLLRHHLRDQEAQSRNSEFWMLSDCFFKRLTPGTRNGNGHGSTRSAFRYRRTSAEEDIDDIRIDGFSHDGAPPSYRERLGPFTREVPRSRISWSRISRNGRESCSIQAFLGRFLFSLLIYRGTGLIVVEPCRGFFWNPQSSSPFSRDNMLWYPTDNSQSINLPMVMGPYPTCPSPTTGRLSPNEDSSHHSATFNEFWRIQQLLTTKYSLLNPIRAESSKDDFDLLCWTDDESLPPQTLGIILIWLLTASAWRSEISDLERRLTQLRTMAMSRPSLETFRPIPQLRQHVADLQDALREAKDAIRESDDSAFAELQKLAGHRLETLDIIFDTLSRQADALSQTASNEIQLVIGSVTIQVCSSGCIGTWIRV